MTPHLEVGTRLAVALRGKLWDHNLSGAVEPRLTSELGEAVAHLVVQHGVRATREAGAGVVAVAVERLGAAGASSSAVLAGEACSNNRKAQAPSEVDEELCIAPWSEVARGVH